MRTLREIAIDIKRNWPKMSPHAVPYVNSMGMLKTMDEDFYFDSADTIVSYFLANAQTWRGADARRIKDELKGMLIAHRNKPKT
jgi:hypothetical protein